MKRNTIVRTASQSLNSKKKYHLNTYNCDLIIQDKNVLLVKNNELIRSKMKYNFGEKITEGASQRIGFTYDDLLDTLNNLTEFHPDNQLIKGNLLKRNHWKIGEEKIQQLARVWSEKKIYR